ncbi:MAG: hypothetical protein WEC33_05225, partial [Dehalococcoidia bacterium]
SGRGDPMSEAPVSSEIPPEARDKARQLGWADDLLDRAVAKGFPMEQVWGALNAGIDGATAAGFLEGDGPPTMQPDLSWMKVPTEWGIRARPADPELGLTIGDLNVGTYGDIPDTWPIRSEIARGSYPAAVLEDMGYTIFEKAPIWADCVVPLYEIAIRDRWVAATDLRWQSLEALPTDTEKAVCQLMTELSDRAYFQGALISGWLPEISYGYHEVKFFLSTVIYDLARHAEAFRKRALANGGGLGLQAPADYSRAAKEARSYPELCAILFVGDSTLHTLFQAGDALAQNQLEQDLYRLCARDRGRLMEYHVERMKHFLFKMWDRREEQNLYFDKAESRLAKEWNDPVVSEPLAILLGGGAEKLEAGKAKLADLRARQVQEYLANLSAATVARTPHPALAAFLPA